jgi:parallel beta-helix repeat protein
VEELEDRRVPSVVLHVSPNGGKGVFTTISAAVAAARPGDFIAVEPGVYQEQVKLTSAQRGVQIEATRPLQAVIEAPANLTGSRAIVDVDGARGVEIEGFTITGPAAGIEAGVLVENGGSARIESNHITRIQDAVSGGLQAGFGVEVGRSSLGGAATTGSAEITGNLIDQYQKGGVVVSNVGSSAEVSFNVVRGVGPTAVIAQNGIEFSDGAVGSIKRNVAADNVFQSPTEPAAFAAAGVLLFQPGAGIEVEGNVVRNNDAGVWAIDAAGAQIRDNFVTGSTFFAVALDVSSTGSSNSTVADNLLIGNPGDGIDLFGSSHNTVRDNRAFFNGGNGLMLDSGSTHNLVAGNVSEFNHGDGILITDSTSSGNTIRGNVFRNNAGTDAVDHSVGAGTAGTANTWKDNRVGSRDPDGLASSSSGHGRHHDDDD